MLGLNKGLKKIIKKYGLGVYISLPHSLMTGIGNNLAPKPVKGSKSWETQVRRSGATFRGTAVVSSLYANSVLFIYSCAGVLELNLLRYSWNDIRVQCEINTEGCQ